MITGRMEVRNRQGREGGRREKAERNDQSGLMASKEMKVGVGGGGGLNQGLIFGKNEGDQRRGSQEGPQAARRGEEIAAKEEKWRH